MSPAGEKAPYRKLPGDFRGIFRRNSLWLGDDHLLQVDSSRFSETYKRFYLRDIQSIIVRKTQRFVVPYYWLLIVVVASIALPIGFTPFRAWLFWSPVAVIAAVIVYLYVASMFQSCACHVVTRVNKVELKSLFRLRSAQQFVDIVAPRIIAAQGQLPANWVEYSASLEELSTAADRNPDSPIDLLPTGQFSWIAVAVFVFVLVDAGLTWVQLRAAESSALTKPNMINMIAMAICATIAIVRLSRQKGSPVLRRLVLAAIFVVAAATYGSVLLQSFDQQFYHETATNPLLYHGMRQLAIGEIIADILVAIPGLILALRQPTGPTRPAVSFNDVGTPTGAPKP